MLSAFRFLPRLLLLILTSSACFAQPAIIPHFTTPDTICVNNPDMPVFMDYAQFNNNWYGFSVIDFNFTQNICNPYELEFAAIGSNIGNPRWNFGDGNTDAGQATVNHLYNAFGVYTVTLTAF